MLAFSLFLAAFAYSISLYAQAREEAEYVDRDDSPSPVGADG